MIINKVFLPIFTHQIYTYAVVRIMAQIPLRLFFTWKIYYLKLTLEITILSQILNF